MRYRRMLVVLSIVGLLLLCSGLLLGLPAPLNPAWQLFSGVYTYDPRVEQPPAGLVAERPEETLRYYLDATLAACAGSYPPVATAPVQRYEIERVTYDGRSNYHAFSLVQARLFYTEARSARVTFRFEAGHNEGDVWYLEHGSTVRAGAWFAVGGLVADAKQPPPGWSSLDSHASTCAEVTPPYKIER